MPFCHVPVVDFCFLLVKPRIGKEDGDFILAQERLFVWRHLLV
jgi:hypothetical protein